MSMTQINWYPGHMKKTKDLIKENLKLIDVVLEVVDSRIPISSKNPDIANLSKNKKRIIVLNKADLVSKEELFKWKTYFKNKNLADEVVELSAETGFNIKQLYLAIDKVSKEKREKLLEKGLKKVNIRIIVLGIPNVGKSRLINRIVGKNSAGVGNKPGFTKGKQWIKIKEGLELLDTPGILWPKFESQEVGIKLAISGAIRDEILPIEDVACEFIKKVLVLGKWDILKERYKLLDDDKDEVMENILSKIALRMSMLNKGGELNILQAAYTLLRDYRAAKLGKFTLDNLD
ncbi:MAG: ribosome biogenesis GTPase YlqF [Fusobacterium sp.]|uniref:ribosome biogenesis GTPase YlqF n=1 Tax=Fusobacterium sp. TaxID=68766 RepID=UPI0026DC5FC0|nr:ribosome biogenesis GTPase YlqF [Fusobacterium sp.]MDO4690282.1 ribosome biogenesis GTPase YlqF [Fusobacterium sp.]